MDRDVNVTFNADVAGYTASMMQAVEATSKMNDAMTGVAGRIGKLNSLVPTMINQIRGLAKENQIATSQAAAYQQKLAGLEATSKVLNKTSKGTTAEFKEIAKTTKQLSRDFPISMDAAVEHVQMLQTSGVTANKSIAGLAESFAKLGAANNTGGAGLGREMLQVSRMFGNDTVDRISKLGDSLTTVSATAGASADSVIGFTKALAPIGSTMGMSQTQMMGISAAMSSVGEDGSTAANALNKVMLDMNKSIRDGSPMIREYAQLMGTTVEETRALFKDNPAEALSRFVTSISEAGPDAIRAMENMGLGGIRSVKAMTTLSRADVRGAMATAAAAYGDGSTEAGAKEAFGGVNDSFARLQETLNQTVANAGTPFLRFLEIAINVGNKFAGVIEGITGTGLIQWLTSSVALVTALVTKITKLGGVLAMLKMGGRWLGSSDPSRTMSASFKAGLGDERDTPGGYTQSGRDMGDVKSGMAYRAGTFWGRIGAPTVIGSPIDPVKNFGSRVARGGMGIYETAMRLSYNQIRDANLDPKITTEAGRQVRGGLGDMRAAIGARDFAMFKTGLADASGGLNRLTNSQNSFGKSLSNVLRAQGRFVVESTKITAQMAAGGIRRAGPAVGNFLKESGIGPGVVAIAGLTAAYSQIKSDESNRKEMFEDGWSNGNRAFNEFAEKTGMATRSLVRLSEAAQKSTNDLAAENKTRAEATEINATEARDAAGPNYKRGYDPIGSGKDYDEQAFKVRLRYGNQSTNTEVARFMADIANKFGSEDANQIGQKVGGYMDAKGSDVISRGLKMQSEALDFQMHGGGWSGKATNRDVGWGNPIVKLQRAMQDNDDANNLAKDVMGETTNYITQMQSLYGKGNAEKLALGEASKVWDDLMSADSVDANVSASVLEKMLGVSGKTKDIEELIFKGRRDGSKTFEDVIAKVDREDIWSKAKTGDFMTAEDNATKTAAKEGDAAFRDMTGKASNFADALDVGRQAALKMGMTIHELASSEELKSLPQEIQNAIKAEASPDDTSARFTRARDISAKAYEDGATPGDAATKLLTILSKLSTTDVNYEAIAKALEITRMSGEAINVGRSQSEAWESGRKNDLNRIRILQETTSPSELVQQEGEAGLAGMEQRRVEMKSFALSFIQQEAEMQRQLTRQRQAFELQESRQRRDFDKQQLRANRDYNLQLVHAQEDYDIQRAYALEDFNTQIARQNEEFAISAQRQAEQTAKSIANPYEKMAAQQVTDIGLLMSNLEAQNKQAQDQLEGVSRLRKMGLSKEAVDQLQLLDPNMNGQVQRLLSGALEDPAQIKKLNGLVADRIKAGQGIAQNEASKEWDNHVKDFQRGQDWSMREFNKSLTRQEKDFKRSTDRTAKQFKTSMDDAAKDFETAMKDAKEDAEIQAQNMHEDLAQMLKNVTKNWESEITAFSNLIAGLPDKVSPNAVKGVTDLVTKMKEAWNAEMSEGWKNPPTNGGGGSGNGAGESFNGTFTDKAKKDAGYYGNGKDSKHIDPGESTKRGYEGAAGRIAAWGSWGAGFGNSKEYFNNTKRHNGVDIKAGEGSAVTTPLGGTVAWVGGINDVKSPWSTNVPHAITGDPIPWAGNSIVIAFDVDKGVTKYIQFAHLQNKPILSAGEKVSPGQTIGTVGNTGNSTGPHLHISTYEGMMATDPKKYLAHGGIATRQTNAVIAEAGHPEAVIPLNERGASVLASAMSRYLSNTDAMQVRTQGHVTYVTTNNTSYDHSTRVTGPITVQSSNPDEMLEKIRQRARRASLVRSR